MNRTEKTINTIQYEIVDKFVINNIPSERSTIDIWCPIIPDTPYQRVLDIKVDSPYPFSIGHDNQYGNLIFHSRIDTPLPDEVSLQIKYLVERTPVTHLLNPERIKQNDKKPFFSQFLQAEKYIDVTPKTRELASQIVTGKENVLEQARSIYDYVTNYMTYDAEKQSWKGSTEHALVCTVGNCNDIHALFLSLCRSIGIPARLIMGQALEQSSSDQENCEICGYHCWAEFYANGLGWIPVDASCACKYEKHQLFGDLEMNHIAWSIGRDVLLYPIQNGDRLLYFVSPYAEIDGTSHKNITRGIHFQKL